MWPLTFSNNRYVPPVATQTTRLPLLLQLDSLTFIYKSCQLVYGQVYNFFAKKRVWLFEPLSDQPSPLTPAVDEVVSNRRDRHPRLRDTQSLHLKRTVTCTLGVRAEATSTGERDHVSGAQFIFPTFAHAPNAARSLHAPAHPPQWWSKPSPRRGPVHMLPCAASQ
jgi:hypothetical protein